MTRPAIVYRCGDVLINHGTGRRWPRPQQPAARTRRHHLRRRHANTAGPAARRTAAHAAPICATASATALPAGTIRSRSPPGPRAFQPRERHPDRLGVRGEPRQPAPHRRGRASRRRDDRAPPPARRAGQQRRPDHRDRVHPPAQAEPGQQHVRAAATHGTRTDPSPRPDPPHQLRGHPHEPGRRVPPRRQPLPALRAAERARHELAFDEDSIRAYAEQRPPPGAFERPFPAAGQREREGPSAFKITRSLFSRPHPDAATAPTPAATDVLTVSDRKPLPPHPEVTLNTGAARTAARPSPISRWWRLPVRDR